MIQKEYSKFKEGYCSGLSCRAYGNNLDLLLRNKVDRKVEEPVPCKKAGKAQSVSTFCMEHHVDRLDWHRVSSSQVRGMKSSGTLCGVQDCEAI